MKAEDQERLQKSNPSQPLTIAALEKHDAKTTAGPCELRQFGCDVCHLSWWRNVIKTNPVSRCKGRMCGKQRYDALPRDMEFGIGRCVCPNKACRKKFFVHCEATDTFKCRKCKCKTECKPYVHPKWRRRRRRKLNPDAPPFPGPPHRRGNSRDSSRDRSGNGRRHRGHNSEGSDAVPLPTYRYPQPPSWEPPILRGIGAIEISPPQSPASPVAPRPRPHQRNPSKVKRKIFNASKIHETTGNTVSTFLSQIDFEMVAEEVLLAYDSDDDDERVGACKFECDCENEYTVTCRMMDSALCYKCDRENNPLHWEPPRDIEKKSNNPHRCSRCVYDESRKWLHCLNLLEAKTTPIDPDNL